MNTPRSHAVRVNDQYRIVFRFEGADAAQDRTAAAQPAAVFVFCMRLRAVDSERSQDL